MESNYPIEIDDITDIADGFTTGDEYTQKDLLTALCNAIKNIEIKLGIDNSIDTNSLDYKIANIPASSQGPQGEIGPKGDKGDKGDTGDAGIQGEQGIQGVAGQNGNDGYTPIKGIDYFDGEQGIQGIQGATGDTGDTGSQGIQGEQGIQGNPGVDGVSNYTIKVQALTSSPTDGQTVYFGMLPKAPTTTANISKVYIRKAGTIKIAEIYCYSGTAGTNEAWSLYIRKNNSSDTLIATLSVNTNERVFSNIGLSIPVVVGDYIEIKSVNPTWSTNPLTCVMGGYIYIE